MEASRDYRRWAFESAALDLALRQAGRSLAEAVGREARPVTFVSSMRLGEPAFDRPVAPLARDVSNAAVQARPDERLGRRADRRARGDRAPSTPSTSRGSTRARSSTSRRTRRSTGVSPRRSRRLDRGPGGHRRDAADPGAACRSDHLGRADPLRRGHRGAPWPPRTINIKPSRFGSVRRLFDAYDYCATSGMPRTAAASGSSARAAGTSSTSLRCFTPTRRTTSPPAATTPAEPPPGLPESPLEPSPDSTGFRWR